MPFTYDPAKICAVFPRWYNSFEPDRAPVSYDSGDFHVSDQKTASHARARSYSNQPSRSISNYFTFCTNTLTKEKVDPLQRRPVGRFVSLSRTRARGFTH